MTVIVELVLKALAKVPPLLPSESLPIFKLVPDEILPVILPLPTTYIAPVLEKTPGTVKAPPLMSNAPLLVILTVCA